MYQGHHQDGSSIQIHSAGPYYPFVIQQRDIERLGVRWELIGPGIDTALSFDTYEDLDRAARRLIAVRDTADAWAFELEQLVTFCGQKLGPLVSAAFEMGKHKTGKWEDMSKLERVQTLLSLGKIRNTLSVPSNNKPTFAYLAARAA